MQLNVSESVLVVACLLSLATGRLSQADEASDSEFEKAVAVAAAKYQIDLGFCGSENFTVFAPREDFLSKRVLAAAEVYRKQIAIEWLGAEMPSGAERAHIHVSFADVENCYTKLSGKGKRADHWMTLAVPDVETALGDALRHEVAHVVMNSRFPLHPPHWLMEGISCHYDRDDIRVKRNSLLARELANGKLPALRQLLSGTAFAPSDVKAYAIVESLTEYLCSVGTREDLLKFADRIAANGVDVALAKTYGIDGVSTLEAEWSRWVHDNNGRVAAND